MKMMIIFRCSVLIVIVRLVYPMLVSIQGGPGNSRVNGMLFWWAVSFDSA